MTGRLFALAAAAAMISAPAFAATAPVAQLDGVKGAVMVSQGGKMVAASATALRAGDRVVAQANGSASVKFADGCVVAVKPASMVTIAAKSPCASGAGLVSTSAQPMQLDSNGAIALVTFAVVGGVLVAVGANDNNNGPSSP